MLDLRYIKDTKKEKSMLECQGHIVNKTLFDLEKVLETTKKRKAVQVFNNVYLINK